MSSMGVEVDTGFVWGRVSQSRSGRVEMLSGHADGVGESVVGQD